MKAGNYKGPKPKLRDQLKAYTFSANELDNQFQTHAARQRIESRLYQPFTPPEFSYNLILYPNRAGIWPTNYKSLQMGTIQTIENKQRKPGCAPIIS